MKYFLFYLLIILKTNRVHMENVKRNQDCSWRCSEGLQCKPKAYFQTCMRFFTQDTKEDILKKVAPLSLSHCKEQPVGSPVFYNVAVSTVLECDGRKCSLQLKTATSLNITGYVRGVSVCANSPGMMEHCQIYNFGHTARANLTGKQVEVQFKCVPVRPGQQVFVTLKTVPNFCKAIRMQRYVVPECSHEDIRDNISECKNGKLVYTVDRVRREFTVKVMDAPVDTNYNLRLCYKRSFICAGEGTFKMIKPQDLQRSITFQYSRALPCLCIEGWPSRADARRVQACPFRNDLEELWSGINYDGNKKELIWEPLCPIKASLSLCHADRENSCRDLGDVFYSHGQKVTFSSVDPHPALCTKFTTDVGKWIKCPFADGNFSVWSAKLKSLHDQRSVEISSWVKANFSVSFCEMKPFSHCTPIERITTHAHVDKMTHTTFNLSRGACDMCVCIKVQRVDVQFSVPVLQCDCSSCHYPEKSYYQMLEKIIGPAAVILTVLLAVSFITKMTIKACCIDRGERTLWRKLGERVAPVPVNGSELPTFFKISSFVHWRFSYGESHTCLYNK